MVDCGAWVRNFYSGRRPALFFVFVIGLITADVLIISLLGFPELGTNIQEYLRSDGEVVDRYDAYRTAIDMRKINIATNAKTKQVRERRLQHQNRGFFDVTDYEEIDTLREITFGGTSSGEVSASSDETEAFRLLSSNDRKLQDEWEYDTVVHRTELHDRLELYYLPKAGGNVLNNTIIAAVRKFEEELVQLPDYDRHCVANERIDDSCRNLVSPLNFYYGAEVVPYDREATLEKKEYIFTPDGASRQRDVGTVSLVMDNSDVLFYFGRDYGRARTTGALRSWGNFGFPLDGQKLPIPENIRDGTAADIRRAFPDEDIAFLHLQENKKVKFTGVPDSMAYTNATKVELAGGRFQSADVDRSEQLDIYQKWVRDVLFPFLEKYEDPTIRVLYHSPYLISHQWTVSILRECLWALGSLAFVWSFSVWYTRTLSLATIGILCSCLAFPLAVGIYHSANYDTFVLLNFMSIFLLMGIGADNVFIYFDLWTISEKNTVTDIDNVNPTNSERTVFTLDHGGRAIFACALTTAGSFLANIASTIGPVREFGFFVGMVVLCNVTCFFVLFPMAVVTFSNWNLFCDTNARESEARGGGISRQNSGVVQSCMDKCSKTVFGRKAGTAWIVKFYMPVLYKLRWFFVFFAITMVLVTFATVPGKFVPTDRAPVFFEPGQHNLADIYDVQQMFSEGYAPVVERYQYSVCRGCDYDPEVADWRNCTWVGPDCDVIPCMHLDTGCGGRGQCLPSGYCDCYSGYEGTDCKITTASNVESDAGHCSLDDDDYCNSAGECRNGVCFCYDGWEGKICETAVAVETPEEQNIEEDDPQEGESETIVEDEEDAGPQPIDCRWSDWGAWSDCSTNCGTGIITRERILLEAAQNGGKCYGQRKETEECVRFSCAVDCEYGNWTEWSVCSVTCGSGTQRRDREQITNAANGGLGCDDIYDMGTEDEMPCVMDPCPVHCQMSDWIVNGECSATCGGGYQDFIRTVLVDADHGGDECPSELTKREPCNLDPCDKDCLLSGWLRSGDCSAQCDGGEQTYIKNILREPLGEGLPCGLMEKTEPCNQFVCSCVDKPDLLEDFDDCAAFAAAGGCTSTGSDVEANLYCSKTCGNCVACDPGYECEGNMCSFEQTVGEASGVGIYWWLMDECPTCVCIFVEEEEEEIVAQCDFGEWTDWSACDADCGWGQEIRTRTDITMAGCNEEQIRSCKIKDCPIDCQYGDWGPWSTCPVSCGIGQIIRELVPGNPVCETLREAASCDMGECTNPSCMVGPWQPSGECSAECGGGFLQEIRHTQSIDGGACPPSTQTLSCNLNPCPIDCVLGDDFIPFGTCTKECDGGTQLAIQSTIIEDAHGGIVCDPEVKTIECNTQECPTPSAIIMDATFPHEMTLAMLDDLKESISQLMGVPVEDIQISTASVTSDEQQEFRRSLLEVDDAPAALEFSRRRLTDLDDTRIRIAINTNSDTHDSQKEKLDAHRTSGAISEHLSQHDTWAGVHDALFFSPAQIADRIDTILPDAQESLFEADRNVTQLYDMKLVATVAIVYGVKGIERQRYRDDGLKGEPIYDAQFDPHSAQAQKAMLSMCYPPSNLNPRANTCVLTAFRTWLSYSGKTLPLENPESFSSEMASFLKTTSGVRYTTLVGFDENSEKVIWIRFAFATNILKVAPVSELVDEMDRWDAYVDSVNKYAPPGANRAYQTSSVWVRIDAELSIVTSTLLCAGISIGSALIIMGLFTGNIILAAYTTLMVFCIVCCLAALIFTAYGWPCGSVEAISLIVFIGFSVDYSMHVCQAYHQSRAETRYDRVADALAHTLGALFAACTSTVGAGCFLLMCQVYVFNQFGIVIISNMLLSLFFGVGVLPALLMILGPLGRQGDLSRIPIIGKLLDCRAKGAEPAVTVLDSDYAPPPPYGQAFTKTKSASSSYDPDEKKNQQTIAVEMDDDPFSHNLCTTVSSIVMCLIILPSLIVVHTTPRPAPVPQVLGRPVAHGGGFASGNSPENSPTSRNSSPRRPSAERPDSPGQVPELNNIN